jgi:Uma2 family endonuclease
MSTVQIPIVADRAQTLVLPSIDWRTYTGFLHALSKNHLRITYDRGTLEIMTLTHEHESDARFLGRLALTLTEELQLAVKAGGSTTFRKKLKRRGLEPDDCFWIASEALVRGKRKIDLRVDPPPDLAIEVDITHSSLNRMSIYATLGVPEIWRYDGKSLTFNELQTDGRHAKVAHSRAFPLVTPADLMNFLAMRGQLDENAVIRQFRAWIQQRSSSGGPTQP